MAVETTLQTWVNDGNDTGFAHIHVQARDVDSQCMGRGGERFVAELMSQRALDAPAAVPVRISDNKDGTYSAAFTPQRVGNYGLSLRSATLTSSVYVPRWSNHLSQFLLWESCRAQFRRIHHAQEARDLIAYTCENISALVICINVFLSCNAF